MKRYLAFIAACLPVFCQNGFGANVRAESAVVSEGQKSVTISINILSESPFSGYQFTLTYDKNILDAESVRNGGLTQGFNLVSNMDLPGTIKAGGFDPGLRGVSGTGVLAEITFDIKKSGTTPISLSRVSLSDSQGKTVAASVAGGRITVQGSPQDPPGQGNDPEDKAAPDISSSSSAVQVSPPEPAGAATRTEEERVGILRERAARRDRSPGVPSRRTEQVPNSPSLESPASGNLLLLVQSEYGNPVPPTGYTTFKKGSTVSCRSESEILVNEMEKALCTGFKGTGSISSGKGTSVSFRISSDTTLTWLWKKVPAEKGFSLDLKEKYEMERETRIPVKAYYTGGLNSPVRIEVAGLPDSFGIKLEKKAITYDGRENVITVSRKGDIPAGEYPAIVRAFSGDYSREYRIIILVPARIKKSVTRKDNTVSIDISPEGKLPPEDSFRMGIRFSRDTVRMRSITPESLSYKLSGRDLLAVAGRLPEEKISISFDISRPSGEISIDIDSFTLKESSGRNVPVKISGQ